MFDGKICLITGGSRGIGRATAQAAAREGAHVIVCSRDAGACADVVATIHEDGGKASAAPADVADHDAMMRVAEQIGQSHGKLDLAFLNAGAIAGGAPLHETPPDQFQAMIDGNMAGMYHSMKAVVPLMKQAGQGAIVVNSAGSGLRGRAGVAAYAGAKWGVIGMSLSAALEVAADNIRLNVIAPGYIATDSWMALLGGQAETLAATVPLKRLGTPEEAADVVTWLLSDGARYLTGTVIPVDGGLVIE